VEEAELQFVRGGMPGRSYFELLLHRHPQLLRVRSVGIESVRAHALTPEAVAKFFAAYRSLCREFNNSRAGGRDLWDPLRFGRSTVLTAGAAPLVRPPQWPPAWLASVELPPR